MHRRRYLTLAGAGLLGGCSGFGGNDSSQSMTATTSRPIETTDEDELTPLPTRSLSEGPEMESFLPPAEDGWTLVDIRGYSVSTLGGRDGIRGVYESQNGVTHHVLVFHAREGDLQISASQFKCAGWSVIAIRDFYIMVAGSGTDNPTLTPEHPPVLEATPIPGERDRSRELLLRSPYFDSSHIATDEIECNRVTSSRTE